MTENYKKALEIVSGNEELKSKIMDIVKEFSSFDVILEKVNPMLEEYGVVLSPDDIDTSGASAASAVEISSDELESVAGGSFEFIKDPIRGGLYTSNCKCVVGGGGTADDKQKACACVFAGVGELTDYGKKLAKDGCLDLPACSDKAPVAMYCPLAGRGAERLISE